MPKYSIPGLEMGDAKQRLSGGYPGLADYGLWETQKFMKASTYTSGVAGANSQLQLLGSDINMQLRTRTSA